ncbi:MAG: DUF1488 family protein [Myxococcales bacterium]|nr:DUF1488 family protein [Myxococcales bacterium]
MKVRFTEDKGFDEARAYVWWRAVVDDEPITLRLSYLGMDGLEEQGRCDSGDDYLELSERHRKHLERVARRKIKDGQTLISHPGENDYLWLL